MDPVLEQRRVLGAPRSEVFGACTDPALLAQWWGPRGFTAPSVELDLRPGGGYRIAMQPPEGELFHLSGTYREVDPPNRLAYTFNWEPPDPDDRETLVTMTFEERVEETEVTVLQEGFASQQRRALHEEGWTDSLDRLQELLESGRPA
jgi:uncharacterized protein YndB with AHSA1/START domain